MGNKKSGILKQEKITDYQLDGQPIKLTKGRGRPKVFRNPLYTPQETKIEAASLYCVLGDIKKVAELSRVSEQQIREWKEE